MLRIALVKIVDKYSEGFTKGGVYEICSLSGELFVNAEIGVDISDYVRVVFDSKESGFIEGMMNDEIKFEVVELFGKVELPTVPVSETPEINIDPVCGF